MQWLNKVDDALDWVLGPVHPTEGDDASASDGDASAVASAARAAAAVAVSTGGNNISERTRTASGIGSSKPTIIPPKIEGIKQNDENISSDSATTMSPLPPPQTPQLESAAPLPNKSEKPSILPTDTFPSTPLVAMAGEFLVVDELPHLTSNINNANCDDGSHCRPPDSFIADEAESTIIEEDEAFISREAEATILQKFDTPAQQIQMPLMPQTKHSEEFVAGRRPTAKLKMDSEQTPVMSRMQDFARASPAPTKVTIGDRERGYLIGLHNNITDRSNQNRTGGRNDAQTNAVPLSQQIFQTSIKDQQIKYPQSDEVEIHKEMYMQGPPSPSKMVIELPAQQPSSPGSSANSCQQLNRHRHSLPISPPPLRPNSNISLVPSTPKRIRPPPHTTRVSRPATPRATPGVIRRRIREPSLSPPESPLDDDTLDIDIRRKSPSIPPPPPNIPHSVSVANSNDKDGVISGLRSPPPSLSPPSVSPPENRRTANDTDTATEKESVQNGDFKTPIPTPRLPLDHIITPVIENRKSSGQLSANTTQIVSLPYSNQVVGKRLDSVLGPAQTNGGNNGADSSAEVETKEDENDEALVENTQQQPNLPPMSQVEKALDWVLGPVKLRTPAPDNDAAPGEDASKEASQDKEEPVTDAITDWFKRMGSTDGRDQKVALSDSFHSQVSNESELTDELDDFALPSPSFSQIEDDREQSCAWDPSLNCYGFFHVRLLRAQRLPCASGSSINAILSLQPWKGRICIPAHITVDGPEGAGVCLKWDKPPIMKRKRESKSKASGSKDSESPGGACSHSMVHAYNSIDTPVPVISLELSTSSMGGVFDRFLCSVSVPCHDLLRNPRNWTNKWYPATVQGDQTTGEEGSDAKAVPLIFLEACFEPKATRASVADLLNQEVIGIDERDSVISEDSDTLGSIPHIIRHDRRLRATPDNVHSSIDDDSISKTSSLTPALIPRNPVTKSHLLRVRSFWTPTWCAVCSKNITTGWMQGKNFECEACHIFCCRDCQLQVDARIPCGSELATIAVKKAEHYSVTSLGQVMTTLAPYLNNSDSAGSALDFGNEVDETVSQSDRRSSLNTLHHVEGIGVMNIRVVRATIFDKTFPPEAEPSKIFEADSNLRNGDHYVRVSWLGSKESKRTKTVLQTSKPFFDSEEMEFDVPHYGMEYKLEVVDANTDKPIGSSLISAQGLLQWQRDDMLAKKDRVLLSLLHLRRFSEPRRFKLELRTGVKDGFGLNFYSSKAAGGPEGKETSRPGEISGWLELDVHLEEDRQLFYSPMPRRCPQRADEEFDIALIQLHIARIGEIIAGIQKIVLTYNYVVSWDNPKITGASMLIFIVVVFGYNLEYLGAFPIGSLVLYMVYLAYLRMNDHFKDRWTLKEKKLLIKSETEIEKNQSIFRPVGLLRVGPDLQGKYLKSRELGLPGSFYTSIMYDPLRYADEKNKSSLVKIDTSSGCTHEVGATASPGITSRPMWTHMHESPELKRLKHLLPDDRLWRQNEEDDSSLAYPILQPITEDAGFSHKEVDNTQRSDGIQLTPFESSLGAVVFQVRFSDVLGSFQVFDNVLGEVVIPLAKLAGSGKVVEGWFRLLDVGTKDTVPGESPDDSSVKSGSSGEDTDTDDDKIPAPEFPELYLRVQFSSDDTLFNYSVQSEMETSKVICEELSRTASIAQEHSGVGVIGSSLNTFNTVRTLGGKLQNQISVVVDMLERVRNAFNFSNPRITVFILLGLTLLWIVLSLIPTRIVVLIAGLAQFGTTLYTKISPPRAKKAKREETTEEKVESKRNGNPIENLFLSIPTDEDLRRTYFWETRRLGEKEREKFAVAKRQTRLENLWKAQWHGALDLKEKKSEQTNLASLPRNWSWEPMFGLLEGHRFIWWRSERHFDTGEAPLGQIFFAGHSGLSGLSPLDLRELSNEEIPLVVSIFGRGTQGQQKITLLAPSSDAKDSLECAVLAASVKAD